ncbi:MAG: hypothetical protein ACRC0L_10455 [Angustibacter sp.]
MIPRLHAIGTSLRLRGVTLISGTFIGVGAVSILVGDRRIPVPAALFGGGIAVPYLLLGPVLPAIGITLSQKFGSWWFEVDREEPAVWRRSRWALLSASCLFSFLPAVLAGAPSSLALAYLRNLLILVAIGATIKRFTDRPQACLAVVLFSLLILTFGWDIHSKPYPWAVLAAELGSTPAVAATIAALLAIWFPRRFSHLMPHRR